MRTAEQVFDNFSYYGSFYETHYLSSNYEKNSSNWTAVLDLIRANADGIKEKEDRKPIIVSGIPKDQIVDFFVKLSVEDSNDYFNRSYIIDFLRQTKHERLESWNLVIENGRATNPIIEELKSEFGVEIHTVLRTSIIEYGKRIAIGGNGKLTVPQDGLWGIDCSDTEKQFARRQYEDDYYKRKKVKFEAESDSDYPASIWYKYVKDRTPTLIVYNLLIQSKCGHEDIFEKHPTGWIGLAIGIPNCGTADEQHVFYSSKDWVRNMLSDEDLQESYEE